MGRGGELSPRMADSAFFSPAANVTMPLVENCELVATMGGARPAPQTRATRKKAGPQKVLRAVGPAIKLSYFENLLRLSSMVPGRPTSENGGDQKDPKKNKKPERAKKRGNRKKWRTKSSSSSCFRLRKLSKAAFPSKGFPLH